MKFIHPIAAIAVVCSLIVGAFIVVSARPADAEITYQLPVLRDTFVNHTFFSGTTTSAVSTDAAVPGDRVLRLDGADKVTFFFSRAWATGGNAGTSRFEIEVSVDGSNWHDFSRLHLTDASKTATSSVSISAATSTTVASMDVEHNALRFVRCLVVETTDGSHSCSASVQY